MSNINKAAVLNPLPLIRTQMYVAPTTIAAKETLRIAVPVEGTTTLHFSFAALSSSNAKLSLATKSEVNTVYVFITNTSDSSINLPSGTLLVATFS